jgi:hypothetical protein
VLAFYVAQHRQEFGVRLALGATPSGLLSLVMRRGAVLLAIGLAIGLQRCCWGEGWRRFCLGSSRSTRLLSPERSDY